jgi:hypothetical protein
MTSARNGGGAKAQIASADSYGGSISNNVFINSNVGINAQSRSEYTNIDNNKFESCTYGLASGSGNMNILGNNFHHCLYSVYEYGTTNSGHSNYIGNLFNHNTYLWIEGQPLNLGDVFSGNKLFYGALVIKNSSNIHFNNFQMAALDSIVSDNSHYLQMGMGWLGTDINGDPIQTTLRNGGEKFQTVGMMRPDTNLLTRFIDQQWRDSIYFKGPIYHTGFLPASSSSSDSVFVRAADGAVKLRAQSDISGGGGTTYTADETTVHLNGSNVFSVKPSATNGNILTTTSGAPTWSAPLVRNLFTDYSDVGNVGGGEDDLHNNSVLANTLANNGDYVQFEMEIGYNANTNSKVVKIYWGSSVVLTVPTVTHSVGGTMTVRGTIVRTGVSSQKVFGTYTSNVSGLSAGSFYAQTSEALSGAVVLKATGTGVADTDIQQRITTAKYFHN